MDWNEIKKFCKGPLKDAFYQISVNQVKPFQRKRFFYISQSETSSASGKHVCWCNETKWGHFYKGQLIAASCQISVHLA